MKFKKLLFGLAGFPLLLTSCNSALSREAAIDWVSKHYEGTSASTKEAIASIDWNYEGTTGDTAKQYVLNIFDELRNIAGSEGLGEIVPKKEELLESRKGQKVRIENEQTITQLNAATFDDAFPLQDDPDTGEKVDNNIYKVTGNSFSGTYKTPVKYTGEETEVKTADTTCIRVYNDKGYCTNFGCKIGGKYIDKDNTIKFKYLVRFVYEDDPID